MSVQPDADVYEITGGNPDTDYHWVHKSQWLEPTPTAICGYNDRLKQKNGVALGVKADYRICPVCDLLASALERGE